MLDAYSFRDVRVVHDLLPVCASEPRHIRVDVEPVGSVIAHCGQQDDVVGERVFCLVETNVVDDVRDDETIDTGDVVKILKHALAFFKSVIRFHLLA